MSPKGKLWSKSVGEWGNKVRVFEPRAGAPLSMGECNPRTGKEDRKSLGHRDKDLAVRQAYERVAERLANRRTVQSERITLRVLEKMYLLIILIKLAMLKPEK